MDFLDMLPVEKPVDAIDYGWMGNEALAQFALDHENVDKLDKEQLHDLVRELALRLDDVMNNY